MHEIPVRYRCSQSRCRIAESDALYKSDERVEARTRAAKADGRVSVACAILCCRCFMRRMMQMLQVCRFNGAVTANVRYWEGVKPIEASHMS